MNRRCNLDFSRPTKTALRFGLPRTSSFSWSMPMHGFSRCRNGAYAAWNADHCAVALARARELKKLIARLAEGELPVEMPVRVMGMSSYLQLPAKPGGETTIALSGYTAEMALELLSATVTRRMLRKAPRNDGVISPHSAAQLGLFSAEASIAPKSIRSLKIGRRVRISFLL